MFGLKLAALYGFYPHQLGFCGPQRGSVKKTLFSYLAGKKVSEKTIRKILAGFKGAFSYYKLIAESNNIEDPFNEKVVKAYWLGNQLLEKVPIDSLKEMIIKEFTMPGFLSKEVAKKKAKEIPLTSKPHHSFQVLVIGSVSGRVVLKGKLLDLCRIGWGKVIAHKIEEERGKKIVIVEYQPLQNRANRYFLGKSIRKPVFWHSSFIPEVKIRDWCAIHWNHVVQILNQKDLSQLKKYSQITIDSL